MRFLLGVVILAMGVSGLAAIAEARHGATTGITGIICAKSIAMRTQRRSPPPEPLTMPDSGTVRAGSTTA